MSQEIVYLVLVIVGWLLRHYGIGSGVKLPGSPTPTSPSANAQVPLQTTVRAEAEAAVKAAVHDAVQAALADLKTSLNPGAK